MSRDELIRRLAQVMAGLQVPISMSMPIGEADKPAREIMNLVAGWKSADEYESVLRGILG